MYGEAGLAGLERFEGGGSSSHLSKAQEEALTVWVAATLPRSTRQVGAYIEREFGVVYESRSGLIALLHRLGLEYSKPETIGRKLDAEKQKAFIEAYENLLNSLGPDEAVLFMDAVHPTHASRPVGCWAPAEENLAIEQTSGRQRLNVHGAIDIETGKTAMIDVETVDAVVGEAVPSQMVAVAEAFCLAPAKGTGRQPSKSRVRPSLSRGCSAVNPLWLLRISPLSLSLAAGACQGVSWAPPQDSGGNLRAYAEEVRRLNAEGASKAIRGVCTSACTIYLGVKKVCVEPTAELWFHAAHLPSDAHPDPLGSLEMLSYYPPRVREWAIRTRALESTDFDNAKKLSGEALIFMGVQAC